MPKGGRREGAGRPVGSPSKITADVRALAQLHGAAVIEQLAHLAFNSPNQSVQATACRELLDRGYGRAVQSMQALDAAGNPANTPMRVIVQLVGDAAPQTETSAQRAAPPGVLPKIQLVG